MICAEVNVISASNMMENHPLLLKAHYTHSMLICYHFWSKMSLKKLKILRDTMGTTEEITILIKYSPKRENILGSTKEKIECESDSDFHANNLLKLSIVLWNAWKHFLQNDQMKIDLKSRIIGVKTQMESFHLFFGLNLGQRIFFPYQ